MEDLRPYIIYKCVVGSRAYGLSTEASDTDLRGCYLPPARLHWGLERLPEQLENEQEQSCYWELEKMLRMALACNPNVLECLNTPLVLEAKPLALEMLELRSCFLSKQAYDRYLGYAEAQFRRLQTSLEGRGEINWKHAMHLVRLLLSGIALVREGRVLVDVSEYRDELLRIKHGETSWEELDRRRQGLQEEFATAFKGTPLPDEPNSAAVNDFLLRARRSMVDA